MTKFAVLLFFFSTIALAKPSAEEFDFRYRNFKSEEFKFKNHSDTFQVREPGKNVFSGPRALLVDQGQGLEILEGNVKLGPVGVEPTLIVMPEGTQPVEIYFSQIRRYTHIPVDKMGYYDVLPLPLNWKSLPKDMKFYLGATVYDSGSHQIAQFREYNNGGAVILNALGTPPDKIWDITSIIALADPAHLWLVSRENQNFKVSDPVKYGRKKGIIWGTFENGGAVIQIGRKRIVVISASEVEKIKPRELTSEERCGKILLTPFRMQD